MQSDIVQRLKEASQGMRSHYKVGAVELIPTSTMDEAAAEITRLRKIVSAFNNGMPPMTTKDVAAENAHMTEALRAAEERVKALREALAWYGEQARLARLIHSEGDAGRHALQDDGGLMARLTLAGAKP